MSTIRCPECKMVNWATALNCKRCSYLFQAAETVVVAASTGAFQPEQVADTVVQPEFTETSFAPNNPETHQRKPAAREPQIAWGAGSGESSWQNEGQYNQPYNQQNNHNYGQNYNQSYGQNYGQQYGQQYGQPNYGQNFPAGNPKIGLAVTSMIFGILGVLTTIFLIGMIFAPIGLILGIVALVKVNKNPNLYGGKGFAIAGVATSGLITIMLPLILVIAIPNVFAARRAANEASAVNIMQVLADAETNYRKSSKGTCADLKTLIGSNLIEGKLENEVKNGYRFNVINYPLGGCEITATPLSTSHGNRSYYFSTDDSLIRAGKKNGLPADKNDRLLMDEMKSSSESSKPTGGGMPFEGAAIGDLKALQSAQTTYLATSGMGKCCADFQTLVNLGLIKPDLADGEDAGYRFQFSKSKNENFEITATPMSSTSSARSFFISPLDGLRGAAKNGLTADKTDPPVE